MSSGRYYFWVQACHPENTDACSAFRAGTGNTAVVLTPPSITRNPSWGTEPASFTVSWGSSGAVDRYELQQSLNDPDFANPTLVYSGSGQSKAFSNMTGHHVYYYRVRACIDVHCGPYRGPTWVEVFNPGGPQEEPPAETSEPEPPTEAKVTPPGPTAAVAHSRKDAEGRLPAEPAPAEAVQQLSFDEPTVVDASVGRASARHPTASTAPTLSASSMAIAEPVRLADARVPRIPAGSGGGGAGSGVRLKVEYAYDAQGYLEELHNALNPAEVYWTSLETDAWGHVRKEQLGNGLTTTRTFDQAAGFAVCSAATQRATRSYLAAATIP